MNTMENEKLDLQQLVAGMDAINDDDLQKDPVARAKVFASARKLCRKLESPWERIARMFYVEPWLVTCIQTASDMGLFKALHSKNEASSIKELAEATGADPVLVKRLSRTLSAAGFLEQISPDTYSTTPASAILLTSDAAGAIKFVLESGYPYFAVVPGYLKKIGYVAPTDMGAWQNFRQTDLSVWEWFGSHPEEMSNFVGMMKVWSATQEPWLDIYPVEALLKDADKDGMIMVDVAGGGGRDIEAFLMKYPSYAGRLVLQDRADEVQAAKISDGIEKMPFDLFGPQPIKGALIYFMHSILHGHTDDQARVILKHIKKSMRFGYSRILAYEDTIKDDNPTELSCGMDLTLMATFGMSARTERDWRSLFDSADLKLVRVCRSHRAGQCVMELELTSDLVD